MNLMSTYDVITVNNWGGGSIIIYKYNNRAMKITNFRYTETFYNQILYPLTFDVHNKVFHS